MSFSKRWQGTAAAVLAAIVGFAAEQKEIDENGSAAEGVINGHARQIESGVKAISAALEGVPEEGYVEAGLWGHANADESGTYGFNVQANSLQTPPKQE